MTDRDFPEHDRHRVVLRGIAIEAASNLPHHKLKDLLVDAAFIEEWMSGTIIYETPSNESAIIS